MDNNRKKSKNSFAKSMKYILSQAKKGSKLHIAMVVGSVVAVCLIVAFAVNSVIGIFSVTDGSDAEIDKMYDKNREALDIEQLGNTVLSLTEDAGQEYVDSTLFIGDSNTVRTMLYGHTTWDNVVAAVSMGVQHITTLQMAYFEGYDEAVTVPEAVKIIQPQRIIITYGTNNTIGYTVETFIETYKNGLQAIKNAYPYADIIINSIPPIDKERENLAVTMQTIDKFNKALADLAQEEGYKFLNSAEALKDEETGFAKKDYTIGDGIHLNKQGMAAMFEYIRTHAYITEDTRPKPLKTVPSRKETPTGIITEDPLAVRGTKIKIVFKSSDTELGTIDGEIEQKVKRTVTTSSVKAVPNVENGGVFVGWTCSYDGLTSTTDTSVRFKVPKVDEDVTEIVVTANFARAGITIKHDGAVKDGIVLEKGQSTQLSAVVSDNYTGDKTIMWLSDDNSIATVDENGKVAAVSGGTTKIYANILNGKIYSYCTVTVNRPLESISISGESNLKTDDTATLTLNLNPIGANADKNNAVWNSSDSNIVSVSPLGVITAHAEGTAVITVNLDGKTASHTVYVAQPKPLVGISILGRDQMTEGDKMQLTIAYDPADTTDVKTAVWSSSDGNIASVTEGAVTAYSSGVVTISCTVNGITATKTITVLAAVTSEPDSIQTPDQPENSQTEESLRVPETVEGQPTA